METILEAFSEWLSGFTVPVIGAWIVGFYAFHRALLAEKTALKALNRCGSKNVADESGRDVERNG